MLLPDLEGFLYYFVVFVVDFRQPVSSYYKEKAELGFFLASLILQLLGYPIGFDEGLERREVRDAECCSLLCQPAQSSLDRRGGVHGDIYAEDRQHVGRVENDTSGG